jgi:hypothetical protein
MQNLAKTLALGAACVLIAGCKVNKTQEGKLPEVNVSAKGGQLPEYNVQGPTVETGSKNETIKVPTVKVKTP